ERIQLPLPREPLQPGWNGHLRAGATSAALVRGFRCPRRSARGGQRHPSGERISAHDTEDMRDRRLQNLWRELVWPWTPESGREAGEAIVRNLWLHWFPAKVARASMSWTYSFWLGTASAALLLILTVTGLLLMVFYVPSTDRAYGTIKDIDFAVSFGWLLRNQHRWAAHGMVALVFLHMARV